MRRSSSAKKGLNRNRTSALVGTRQQALLAQQLESSQVHRADDVRAFATIDWIVRCDRQRCVRERTCLAAS